MRNEKLKLTNVSNCEYLLVEKLVIGGCGCLFIGCILMVQCVYNPQTAIQAILQNAF